MSLRCRGTEGGAKKGAFILESAETASPGRSVLPTEMDTQEVTGRGQPQVSPHRRLAPVPAGSETVGPRGEARSSYRNAFHAICRGRDDLTKQLHI